MKNLFLLSLLVIILLLNACSKQVEKNFEIKRGVNLSHWLSQSQRRGVERDSFLTEKDIKWIASLGYDHVRLPIDEEQMWDSAMNKERRAFELLHNCISWCSENNLRIIVDLHIIRSHHFNNEVRPLWTDAREQDKFVSMWNELSAELKKYPNSLLAYELMNEAVTDSADLWNNLIARAVAEVRTHESERKIVIGSNMWQSANTFDELKVPENDPNIILSFHFYSPFPLTHHQASWTGIKDYTGPVNYPGQLIDSADLAGLDSTLVNRLKWDNRVYNIDTLEKMIQEPIRVAKAKNLPLYCGEFGCLPTVSTEARLAWYNDMITMLNRNGIAWANWDYKGGFGIVDSKTGEPVQELVDILMKE
jgi:endoglucanase